jgi:predicted nucleotidyltransferase
MVNTIKLKLTNLQQDTLRVLFVHSGQSLNQRTIARILKVSSPAVMKALPALEKDGLIKLEQDKESKRWAIQLNSENSKAMQLKRVENLKLVYESGLADYLGNELSGSTIFLFGSYSFGEDNFQSDIDIAVIGRKEKTLNLEKFEKIFSKKIVVQFYDSFKDMHKNLKESILNGILLKGSVEL